MPTYEYECKSCLHGFEVFQSMSDSPLEKCPKCGSEVRRLIFGGAGVIFKGSGFYVTDKSKTAEPAKPSDAGKTACDSCPAAAAKECPASAGSSAASTASSKTEKTAPETKTA